MSKWLVEGTIRCVIEADSADEAEQILNGELSCIDAYCDEIEDWDEISIGDAEELPEDDF